MKRFRVLGVLALVGALSSNAAAVGDYDESQTHPLRLLSYALAPAGFAAEWLIARPLHRLVSQDDLAPVFSYTPHAGFEYETYFEGLESGVSYQVPQSSTHRRD